MSTDLIRTVEGMALFLALLYAASSHGQGNEYKSQKFDYSISFPKDWIVNEDNHFNPPQIKAVNSLQKKPGDYGEINIVVMSNVSENMLQTLMEKDIAIAKRVSKSFEIAKDQPTVINKRTAFVVELLIPLANHQRARILNYGIAQQGNLYFIRCFADEDFFQKSGNQIRASCASFKIGSH